MRTAKIISGTILALVIIVLAAGIYKFNFKNDDIFYKADNIQPESRKLFFGSWYRTFPENKYKEGFTLKPDSSATSINMSTLLYKKWRIKSGKLILTAISLGNHSASVGDEEYIITSYNDKKMYLEKNGQRYIYKKAKKRIATNTEKEASLNSAFEYFPVDVVDITNIPDTKHPLDFKSNKEAIQFKTIISEKYKENKRNFAGCYSIITWGCGSGCLDGVMVDTRNGKIYDLPSAEGYSDIGNHADHSLNSILLMTSFRHSTYIPNTTNRQVDKYYWLWNEPAKEFVKYKSVHTIEKC